MAWRFHSKDSRDLLFINLLPEMSVSFKLKLRYSLSADLLSSTLSLLHHKTFSLYLYTPYNLAILCTNPTWHKANKKFIRIGFYFLTFHMVKIPLSGSRVEIRQKLGVIAQVPPLRIHSSGFLSHTAHCSGKLECEHVRLRVCHWLSWSISFLWSAQEERT